jgi:hypothetical protein
MGCTDEDIGFNVSAQQSRLDYGGGEGAMQMVASTSRCSPLWARAAPARHACARAAGMRGG